ncbi:MAG TPA: bile acid:sodium symporter [Solirubrobacteraceae bacterium]|nr:bile acid:sodium symporter [Solirubrobacteraceae bacterium]
MSRYRAVQAGAKLPSQALAAAPRALTPLALVAAALALVVPSAAVAHRADLLLALLVLATALGIPAAELVALRRRAGTVALLSLAPLIVLGAVAWLLGHLFATPERDGLLAVGFASSEVASVGLVALAGGDAAAALGIVTASLVLSALLGPVALEALGTGAGAGAGHGGTGHLLARFALVVIAPLIAGVAIRTAAPRALHRIDGEREGIAALTVAALVYAALSGASGTHGLGAALEASLLFLAVSAALGELWRRRAPAASAIPGALTIAMRDFAVAAALASQAFGTRAAAVPGVYGVVMLLAGSAAAGSLARHRPAEATAGDR